MRLKLFHRMGNIYSASLAHISQRSMTHKYMCPTDAYMPHKYMCYKHIYPTRIYIPHKDIYAPQGYICPASIYTTQGYIYPTRIYMPHKDICPTSIYAPQGTGGSRKFLHLCQVQCPRSPLGGSMVQCHIF